VFEWNEAIQIMINDIEDSIKKETDENLILKNLSDKLGYSKFHTTRFFKKLTGLTFKNYLRLRRLSYAVIELRDKKARIIDIAAKHGFSSHEAFSRAFKKAYGITPNEYRKKPVPLVLQNKINTFDRYFLGLGECTMKKVNEKQVKIYLVTLPTHKFLHIKNYESKGYWDFWRLQENIKGQDCHTVCGLLDSIKGKLDGEDNVIGQFSGQIMGYLYEENGKIAEAYGVRLPVDYLGEIPKQMLCIDVPESEYIVFEYPPFDYESEGATANQKMDDAEKNFDYSETDYELEMCNNRVGYSYHDPDKYLKTLRPVKRK